MNEHIYYNYTDENKTEVRRSELSGNGVFAKQSILEGHVIERCRVILTDLEDIKTSALYPYCFGWHDGRIAIALGNAPLYNHSDSPNAKMEQAGVNCMIFVALKPIAAGEEILIDYGLE